MVTDADKPLPSSVLLAVMRRRQGVPEQLADCASASLTEDIRYRIYTSMCLHLVLQPRVFGKLCQRWFSLEQIWNVFRIIFIILELETRWRLDSSQPCPPL